MTSSRSDPWSRREFLGRVTGAAGGGSRAYPPDGQTPSRRPRRPGIRLVRSSGLCISPLYLAEELLRLEGFTEVEYVQFKAGISLRRRSPRGRSTWP